PAGDLVELRRNDVRRDDELGSAGDADGAAKRGDAETLRGGLQLGAADLPGLATRVPCGGLLEIDRGGAAEGGRPGPGVLEAGHSFDGHRAGGRLADFLSAGVCGRVVVGPHL